MKRLFFGAPLYSMVRMQHESLDRDIRFYGVTLGWFGFGIIRGARSARSRARKGNEP